MTGTPEGSTQSGFMEKPGIEPSTPGLQGLALIHYTTGAFSPGSHFNQQSRTVCAIFVEAIIKNISVKIYCFWNSG